MSGQGKCEGNKRYDETASDIVKVAKRLYRKNPKTGKRRSLRVIADELFRMGYTNRKGKIFLLRIRYEGWCHKQITRKTIYSLPEMIVEGILKKI